MSDAVRNESALQAAAGTPHREFVLREALDELVRRSGSDLHLKVGRPPMIRVTGELHETQLQVLRPDDLKKCAEQLLNPRQREEFAEKKEIDFAIGVPGLGRFRTNIFHQRGTLGMAFRAIPVEVPDLSSLDLPPVLEQIALSPRGARSGSASARRALCSFRIPSPR